MDKELNPGQNDINSKTSFETLLHNAENNKTQSDDINDIDGLKNAEENSNTSWKNNVSAKSIATSVVGGKFRTFFTKKGPAGTIMLTLLLGGMGISTLLSPSLLVLQMREVFTDKFNTQLTSLEKRTNRMYTNKLTTGACTSIVIACKYSTFSEKQLANFKKAGFDIEVDADASKTLTGRSKVKNINFNGESISPSTFNNRLNTDPKFRSAVRVAYNPKLASFSDSAFNKVAGLLKVSKIPIEIKGDTDEENLKQLQEKVNKPEKVSYIDKKTIPDDADKTTKTELEEENRIIDEQNQKIDELNKNIDDLAKNPSNNSSDILDALESNDIDVLESMKTNGVTLDKVSNLVKITGPFDAACQLKNITQLTAVAAKTVRATKLANFAMQALALADKIKAGEADAKTVSYFGRIFTLLSKNGKSATDGVGFKWAMFGDKTTPSTASSKFMVGGGYPGKLNGVMSAIDKSVAGSVSNGMCAILGNPIVGGASLVAGIGMLLLPEVRAGVTLITALKAAGTTAAEFLAPTIIPALLKDTLAGNLIDKNTIGESAGDAFASGSAVMMGSVAHAGGNAPLSPSQAVVYSNSNKEVLAKYAEEDRLVYGQFDITNSNTFLGKLALNLTPYISNMSSLSGIFNSITSMPLKSFASITTPVSYAESADEYTMCQDEEYRNLGVATDPFCNIIYGISTEDLSSTPAETAELLYNQIHRGIKNAENDNPDVPVPQINDETGAPIDNYTKFVNQCIEKDTSKNPFKSSSNKELSARAEKESKSGATVNYLDEDCLYGKEIKLRNEIYHYVTLPDGVSQKKVTDYRTLSISNKYFYIHYMDQRIENMMDNI